MKKILFAFLAAACLLSSCSKDNTNGGDGPAISISCGEIINASPAGEVLPVTVTSSGAWRLAGVSDWVHPSAMKGGDGDQLTLTIDPNQTGEVRVATFKFFTGSAVSTLTINSAIGKQMMLVSPAAVSCNRNSQDIQVTVTTNIPELTYAFSDGGDQWLTFDSRSDAFGQTILVFKAKTNLAYEDRKSVISISSEGISPVEVTLTQKQTDIIKVDKLVESLTLAASELTIKLETNVEYTVEIPTKNQSWIHRKTTLASRGLVGASESFIIDAAAGLRGGNIIFKSKDGATTTTVAVVQSGDVHTYTIIPDEKFRKFLFDSDFAVPVAGETTKIELTMDGIEATRFVFPENGGIFSVEGITVFTKLTYLNCSRNKINSIVLGSLPVTEVKMHYSTATDDVVLSGDNIEKIDAYYSSKMSTFDVSGCPKLTYVSISDCDNLSTLYLKTGTTPTIHDPYAGYNHGSKYTKIYK